MSVSKKIRISLEKASWIRKMFEEGQERRERFGAENVFDFSLGNPNLEPPVKFKNVLAELANDPAPGQHAYMHNAGYVETRQAVAGYLNGFNDPEFTADEIIMTVGAGGALNVIFRAILDPGDEIIIPKPYFMEYDSYLANHQGTPRLVPSNDDFSLDLDAIEAAISERTKGVLINSPNNPTGRVYQEKELKGLGDILSRYSDRFARPIYLICDEPYRKIIYDDIHVPSIFNLYSNSVIATSFSKDLSLPGERIGYVAVSPEISERNMTLSAMVFCNRILGFVNAPALMQRAVRHLLEENIDISEYKKKRDRLCDALQSFGYAFIKPEGTFYLFPKSPLKDDVAFVRMLQEKNILTVPGSGFGAPGFFRIAFCVSDRVVEGALPGFEKAMKQCGK